MRSPTQIPTAANDAREVRSAGFKLNLSVNAHNITANGAYIHSPEGLEIIAFSNPNSTTAFMRSCMGIEEKVVRAAAAGGIITAKKVQKKRSKNATEITGIMIMLRISPAHET